MTEWSDWVRIRLGKVSKFINDHERVRKISLQCTAYTPRYDAVGSRIFVTTPGTIVSEDSNLTQPLPSLGSSLMALATVKNLTSLTIECFGLALTVDQNHLCPALAAQLPTLQHLDLALGRICTRLLDVPAVNPAINSADSGIARTDADTNTVSPIPSNLRELTIRLTKVRPTSLPIHLATSCEAKKEAEDDDQAIQPFYAFRKHFMKAMKTLVRQQRQTTPSLLKTANLIWQEPRDGEMHVMDFFHHGEQIYYSTGGSSDCGCSGNEEDQCDGNGSSL